MEGLNLEVKSGWALEICTFLGLGRESWERASLSDDLSCSLEEMGRDTSWEVKEAVESRGLRITVKANNSCSLGTRRGNELGTLKKISWARLRVLLRLETTQWLCTILQGCLVFFGKSESWFKFRSLENRWLDWFEVGIFCRVNAVKGKRLTHLTEIG